MLSTHPGAGLPRIAAAAKEGAGLVSCPGLWGLPREQVREGSGERALLAMGKWEVRALTARVVLALHLVLASDHHWGGPSELSRS